MYQSPSFPLRWIATETNTTNTIRDRTDESFFHWGGATISAPCESCKEAKSTTRSHEKSFLKPRTSDAGRSDMCHRKDSNSNKRNEGYKLSIIGIFEVMWTGFGEVRTTTGETIIYSDKRHHSGVALVINDKARKCLMK